MLKEIRGKDPTYDPLPNCKELDKRLRIIMNNFNVVNGTMNEKLGYNKKVKLIVLDNE